MKFDKLIVRVKDGDIVYLLHSIASHQLGDNIALNHHSTDSSHLFIVFCKEAQINRTELLTLFNICLAWCKFHV